MILKNYIMIKVIDLFCGCGGLSMGFYNKGFDIIKGYDNWEPAVKTYSENFSHDVENCSIPNDLILKQILSHKIDMIIGGPPCQDFSIAGKRNDTSKRANLTTEFIKLCCEVNPNWIVMENVYNIEKNPIISIIDAVLRENNYGVTKIVLDASFLGVPQKRKRFFLIAKKNEEKDFIKDHLQKYQNNKVTTVHEYLKGKIDTEYYYMHPRSYKRRAIFSIYEPSSTIRGVNRPIPKNYKFHSGDKIKDLSKVRSFTSKERSFIQTFPSNFKFHGNKTEIEQLIGNAVPVKMAEYVAHIINLYNENGSRSN